MVRRVFARVYGLPVYWLVTGAVAALTMTVMVLLPHYSILLSVLLSPVVSLLSKVAFFGSLYGSLATNYSLFAACTVVMISMLFGVNAALLLFYVRRAQKISRFRETHATTVGGLTAAALGIGCAACGSAIIGILLQFLGIGWIVSYLPLHGAEFGFLGVILLLFTTYSLAKKIDDPLVCPT